MHNSKGKYKCLGLIKRCFESNTEKTIKTLYDYMIIPVLEYASPAWNPYSQKGVNEIENTKKRAPKLSRPPAESVSLEQRRREADL